MQMKPDGRLVLLVAEDIRVTGVEDGHGGAAEELATGGAKLNLYKEMCKPI